MIEIKNPNKLPMIKLNKVRPLQGGLKDLSEANYKKLKGVLEKRGFEIPLFIWFHDETPYLMDGHQRHRVMMTEQPAAAVPYLEIKAKDEQEAKSKLLEITSQYGTITAEGYMEFTADLPEVELIESVNFDAFDVSQSQGADSPPEENQDTCPECGQVLRGKFRKETTV